MTSAAHRLAGLRTLYAAERERSEWLAATACAWCRRLRPLIDDLSADNEDVLLAAAGKFGREEQALVWRARSLRTLAKIRAMEAQAWGALVLNDHAERVVK